MISCGEHCDILFGKMWRESGTLGNVMNCSNMTNHQIWEKKPSIFRLRFPCFTKQPESGGTLWRYYRYPRNLEAGPSQNNTPTANRTCWIFRYYSNNGKFNIGGQIAIMHKSKSKKNWWRQFVAARLGAGMFGFRSKLCRDGDGSGDGGESLWKCPVFRPKQWGQHLSFPGFL